MKKVLIFSIISLIFILVALYFNVIKVSFIQEQLINSIERRGNKLELLDTEKDSNHFKDKQHTRYIYKLNDKENLTIYKFKSISVAKQEFKNGVLIDSYDIPHIYTKERFIVIYIGSDRGVVDILDRELGKVVR